MVDLTHSSAASCLVPGYALFHSVTGNESLDLAKALAQSFYDTIGGSNNEEEEEEALALATALSLFMQQLPINEDEGKVLDTKQERLQYYTE